MPKMFWSQVWLLSVLYYCKLNIFQFCTFDLTNNVSKTHNTFRFHSKQSGKCEHLAVTLHPHQVTNNFCPDHERKLKWSYTETSECETLSHSNMFVTLPLLWANVMSSRRKDEVKVNTQLIKEMTVCEERPWAYVLQK